MIKAFLKTVTDELDVKHRAWCDEDITEQAFSVCVEGVINSLRTIIENVPDAIQPKPAIPDHRQLIEEERRKIREARALKDPDSVEGVGTMRAVELEGQDAMTMVPASMPEGAYIHMNGVRHQLRGNVLRPAPQEGGA